MLHKLQFFPLWLMQNLNFSPIIIWFLPTSPVLFSITLSFIHFAIITISSSNLLKILSFFLFQCLCKLFLLLEVLFAQNFAWLATLLHSGLSSNTVSCGSYSPNMIPQTITLLHYSYSCISHLFKSGMVLYLPCN